MHKQIFSLVVGLVLFCNLTSAFAEENKTQLPVLNWEPRSDWINVKDSETFPITANTADFDNIESSIPAAVGDGKADDTDTIEALLDMLKDGDVLYFPPGEYRITRTLYIDPTKSNGANGISLIGHGRTTIIAWDGKTGGIMFSQSTGWPLARYVGLTWDGRGKAAIGFLHRCMKRFETEVKHQHEAFLNFTESGIHLGGGALATAEISYTNCLFDNCNTGILINGADQRSDNNKPNFNYLDNTVSGCEFRNCARGVFAGAGTNVYVRESHFENIKDAVLTTNGEAGNSIRRCTAKKIGRFAVNGSSVGPLVVQDCWIADWTTPSGVPGQGVIQMGSASAPSLVFDVTFQLPEGKAKELAPPLVFGSGMKYFVANNRLIEGAKEPQQLSLAAAAVNMPQLGTLVPVTEGNGVITSAEQTFFRSTVVVPSKIFDARKDFGAVGDGKKDDTAALQKTIDAAKAYGKDALAYLPKGSFAISAPLKMTGSNYRLGGRGWGSAIIWKGSEGGITLEISDPDNLTLENIIIGRHDFSRFGKTNNSVDVRQTSTGSGKKTRMTYDKVHVHGMYQYEPNVRGLQLLNLTKDDTVFIDEVNGNIRINDSSDASIYMATSYEGTICIEGKSTARNGFIGAGVRLGTCSDPGIWIKDNQSFIISDLYCESSRQYMRLDGDNALPPGVVVVSGPKFEIEPKANEKNPSIMVNDYKGELLIGPYNYYVMNPRHWFKQEGKAPFTMVLWAASFYNSAPFIDFGSGTFIGKSLRLLDKIPDGTDASVFNDTGTKEDALKKIGSAVDRMRALSHFAVKIAYP